MGLEGFLFLVQGKKIEEEASALRTNPRAFGLLVEGDYFLLSSCSDLKADRNILVVSFRLP